jgi:hypothetical protein
VDSVPDPLLLRKCGMPGIELDASVCSKDFWTQRWSTTVTKPFQLTSHIRTPDLQTIERPENLFGEKINGSQPILQTPAVRVRNTLTSNNSIQRLPLVDTLMKTRVSETGGNFLSNKVIFPKRILLHVSTWLEVGNDWQTEATELDYVLWEHEEGKEVLQPWWLVGTRKKSWLTTVLSDRWVLKVH